MVINSIKRTAKFDEYRALWHLAPRYHMLGRVPMHLDLEVTTRCQLKCPGCPSVKTKYSKGDMNPIVAMVAMEKHRQGGGLSVKFNWRGEPTLYPYLGVLVAYATKLGYVDTMINTNGVAMDEEMSRVLLGAGIKTVAWSIDSVEPTRYAKLRPGANLKSVLKNLETFCRLAEKMKSDVFIRVQRIRYPDEKMSDQDFCMYFARKFPRVNSVATNAYKEKDTSKVWEGVPSEPCAQLWQRLIIMHDGQVGPCCEANRFGKSFGHFPEDDLTSIWHCQKLNDLRRLHSENRQNEIEACAKCTVTKV